MESLTYVEWRNYLYLFTMYTVQCSR